MHFDVFFYVCLKKRPNKQSGCRWFETPWLSLWRHYNGIIYCIFSQVLMHTAAVKRQQSCPDEMGAIFGILFCLEVAEHEADGDLGSANCTWVSSTPYITMTSNERHRVLNHRSFGCLFNSLCGLTSMKHQNLHYWPFVRRWIPRTKGQ